MVCRVLDTQKQDIWDRIALTAILMPCLLHSSKDQIELKRLMGWSKNLKKKLAIFRPFFFHQNVDGLVLVEQSYLCIRIRAKEITALVLELRE